MKTKEEILDLNIEQDYKNVPVNIKKDFEAGRDCPNRRTALKAMEEYADQFKPKWTPFEIWIETALPGAIVNTYSDVYLHQFECEFDGESIEIFGYNYYPGETKIWIMDIPEPPKPTT